MEPTPGRTIVSAVLAALAAVLATATAGGQRGADTPLAARLGEAAPDFTLKDQDGRDVKLSQFKGKIIVLQWLDPVCPAVVRHYEADTFIDLTKKWEPKDVVQLAIHTGGSVEGSKRFYERHNLNFPLLADPDAVAAKAFDAKTAPHMFVIDREGKLAYTGAIDDDPDGKGAKVNYVDQALEELTNGRPVSQQETKPYGCEVKK